MNITEEFCAYDSVRAIKWLQQKKVPYNIYGSARCCKAVVDGDVWSPAPYTPDGKIPAQNGIDVILFPLIQDGEIVNILAFEPGDKEKKLYLRLPDNNLWAMLDLIGMI